MRAKVDNALLYGSKFLFLVPSAASQLERLQLEFERSLLTAPSWMPDAFIRAVGGWSLTWGDCLVYDALVFLGELWCCESGMLVRTVWAAAQDYPGRTFAATTRQSLVDLGLPEIFETPDWEDFLQTGKPVLPRYKAFLKEELSNRSIAKWRVKFFGSSQAQPYHLSQQFPCNAGARLLEADHLDVLKEAAAWDAFRLCLGDGRHLKSKQCILRGGMDAGHAHILATWHCQAVSLERASFLAGVDSSLADSLSSAPPADWPIVLLNPHLELQRLREVVYYVAQIMDALGRRSKPQLQ
jgi:hypothetical protein